MDYVLSHLGSALLCWGLLYAAGAALDVFALAGRGPWPDRFLLRIIAGGAAWTVAAFGAACLGLLGPPLMGALAVAAALGGALALRREPPSWPRPAPAARPLLLAMACLFGFLALAALSPTPAWDANTYHLTIPRLYLEAGGFVRIPYLVNSNWPLNGELLFALAMLLGDYVTANLLHLGFLGVALYAVYRAGALEGSPLAGLLGAALLLANNVVLSVATCAYVDVTFAAWLFVGLLFAWRGMEEGRTAVVVAGGVALGLAAGTKLSGILALPCLVAVTLVHARVRGRSLGDGSRAALCAALPLLLLLAPWVVKAWSYTGNPVYPFCFKTFGGPEWSEALSVKLRAAHGYAFGGREGLDCVLAPLRALAARDGDGLRAERLTPAWLLVLPAALWAARRAEGSPVATAAPALGAAALTFLVGWAFSPLVLRYAVPALPLAAAACGLGLAALAATPRARRLAMAGAALLVLLEGAPWVAEGALEARDALRLGPALLDRARDPVWAEVDRTPRSSRILLLDTNWSFFCRRSFLADTWHEASQVGAAVASCATPAELLVRLQSMGVTHVLVHYGDQKGDYPPMLRALLQDLSRPDRGWTSPSMEYKLIDLKSKGRSP